MTPSMVRDRREGRVRNGRYFGAGTRSQRPTRNRHGFSVYHASSAPMTAFIQRDLLRAGAGSLVVLVTRPDQIASFAGEKTMGNRVVGLAGDQVLAIAQADAAECTGTCPYTGFNLCWKTTAGTSITN